MVDALGGLGEMEGPCGWTVRPGICTCLGCCQRRRASCGWG